MTILYSLSCSGSHLEFQGMDVEYRLSTLNDLQGDVFIETWKYNARTARHRVITEMTDTSNLSQSLQIAVNKHLENRLVDDRLKSNATELRVIELLMVASRRPAAHGRLVPSLLVAVGVVLLALQPLRPWQRVPVSRIQEAFAGGGLPTPLYAKSAQLPTPLYAKSAQLPTPLYAKSAQLPTPLYAKPAQLPTPLYAKTAQLPTPLYAKSAQLPTPRYAKTAQLPTPLYKVSPATNTTLRKVSPATNTTLRKASPATNTTLRTTSYQHHYAPPNPATNTTMPHQTQLPTPPHAPPIQLLPISTNRSTLTMAGKCPNEFLKRYMFPRP
nr:uncharacterized protein LOC113825886 [Penaeus vannamei]